MVSGQLSVISGHLSCFMIMVINGQLKVSDSSDQCTIGSIVQTGNARPMTSDRPKIRFNHLRIVLDLFGQSQRDRLSIVYNLNSFADAHHDLHVVFDQQDR